MSQPPENQSAESAYRFVKKWSLFRWQLYENYWVDQEPRSDEERRLVHTAFQKLTCEELHALRDHFTAP